MTAAYLLCHGHDIHVFEAQNRIGGHTHTIECEDSGRTIPVDTGFIVFNDRTYPNFIKLVDRLGVPWRHSTMSFSVRCDRTGLEYNGATLNSLFAQRSNLLRPGFYRMLTDILRFNRDAIAAAARTPDVSLGRYLDGSGYSRRFIDHYIVPMAASIWSAPQRVILEFPLPFFVRFLHNHGMLSVNDRPVWRTIVGGSSVYARKLTEPFAGRIRLNSPVRRIARAPGHVAVSTDAGTEHFDRVVIACHSDEALSLLADPTPQEREILGSISYQRNTAVLHTDTSLLPRRTLAWAAWNYHVPPSPDAPVTVTYDLTALQGLATSARFLVTLNRDDHIDPAKVIRRIVYHHPVFSTR
ncbi:MAG: FAD-dependent oxidoreductase, partial [Phycisphaerales bacterium]|nr:FAD-dependent oxidoreductase [Phycisphaerales bacterium]